MTTEDSITAFRRTCALAHAKKLMAHAVEKMQAEDSIEGYVNSWPTTCAVALSELVRIAQRALSNIESIGATAARVLAQAEISLQPSTKVDALLLNVEPLESAFFGKETTDDGFKAQMQLIIDAFDILLPELPAE